MIYEHDCDTQLPNNIYDDEFNPETKELPPSRPVTEATPVSYMIAKARLCFELGNILQATNRLGKGVPYDEIIRFDATLRRIMQELPPHLKLGYLPDSRDPVTLIIARFNIDILYHKIMCLLHRKYICKARQNPRYAHSRRSAIEASLQAMEHLQTLHRESQGDGRLQSVAWYVKSIATKEFILPAMLIVLDLHYDNMADQSGLPDDSEGTFRWSPEQRAKMITSLEDAAIIWKSLADGSMEAFKGAKTVDIMLQKLKESPKTSDRDTFDKSGSLSNLAQSAVIDPSLPSLGPGTISSDGMPDFGDGLSPFTNTNSSAFMGMEFSLPTPNMGDSGVNPLGPQSPMSMFTNLGGAPGLDVGTNFDWVRLHARAGHL